MPASASAQRVATLCSASLEMATLGLSVLFTMSPCCRLLPGRVVLAEAGQLEVGHFTQQGGDYQGANSFATNIVSISKSHPAFLYQGNCRAPGLRPPSPCWFTPSRKTSVSRSASFQSSKGRGHVLFVPFCARSDDSCVPSGLRGNSSAGAALVLAFGPPLSKIR